MLYSRTEGPTDESVEESQRAPGGSGLAKLSAIYSIVSM